MFFTLEKFEKRVQELEGKRYFGHQCIAPFVSMEGTLPEDEAYHSLPDCIEGPEFGMNDFFVGRDKYLWLEKTVTVPKSIEGCDIVGLFNFGKGVGGNNSGFESLLYVDGHPYQGVDTKHQEVLFDQPEGTELRLTFLLWTGLEGDGNADNPFARITQYHQCKKAHFAYLHKKTDELYYFSKAIWETLALLDTKNEQYEDLIGLLDRTLNYIDWDGSAFYDTVEVAHEFLMNGLAKMEKRTDVTVNVVGHTHIDVAWLWRLKHTREKAQRSFSTVLRLMERYDEYIFLQTQPQLYKYIKEDCPELYEKIKERIAEGRWEPDGGMWVEADCNITSGEALVRQFLHGIRFIEQEFGKKCEYLWLPDVFGYSWALPQILQQCEISTFMTTKISWNQYNKLPNDIFLWKGIDGSEILTYFVDVPRTAFMGMQFSTYGCSLKTKDVKDGWDVFKNKELTKDVLVCYGYGDGGGGVNRDMLEMRRAFDKIPGLPNVKSATAGEFFRKLHDNVENTDRYVHTWDGELYFEYHRGTYTTQAYNKKTNRHLENKLAQIEWLSSLSYILGGEYAQKKLQDSWECVLLHQFHDIIPGSSINEVYKDSHINYEKAEAEADEAKDLALATVVRKEENSYTLYSTNSFGGKELVWIPEERCGYFTNEDGNQLEAQKAECGYHILADVKPFAAVKVIFCETKENTEEKADTFCAKENGIETPYYSISWNADGQICTLYDKKAERNVIKEGQCGNVLQFYEDKSMFHPAWDIDLFYVLKEPEIAVLEGTPEVVELGNLQAVVRFHYRYRDSVISQDMIVYKDSRRIDFKTHVDWKETNKLFKAAFHTDIRSVKATYDIQFGHVERPTHWNTSWDWARFEVCAHKWADLSETGYGVAILNDCKYGYSIKDEIMKITLLKSPKWPDCYADMGEHDFTYSLLPHQGSVIESDVIEEANRLNLPAQVIEGTFADKRKLVKVSVDNVQIDAVKKAEDEDCLIVRIHECKGARVKMKLSSEFPVSRIVPCNMLEHDCGEAVSGSEAEFKMKPFEIKTFKFYF